MNIQKKYFDFLIPAFFVFLHLEIATPFGYHLTLGAVLGFLIVLLLSSFRFSKKTVLLILGINAVLLLTPLFNSENFNLFDFITTGLLIEFSIFVLAAANSGTRVNDLKAVISTGIKISFWVVSVFSLIQILFSSIAGVLLYNLWGRQQYLYNYAPVPGPAGFIRSPGFYLEPSFDAFVICSLTILVLLFGADPSKYLLPSLLAVLSTQSATGIIVWLILVGIALVKNGTKKRGPFLAILALGFAASYGYLAQRLDSISMDGSSGHYRILSPTEIIGDLLSSQFFGYPLGSLYNVVAEYQLFQFGSNQSLSLDNGIYVVIFYFGWIGAIALASAMLWIVFGKSQKIRNNIIDGATLKTWIFLSLLFSGAVFAPEFTIITYLVVIAWRNQSSREKLSLAT